MDLDYRVVYSALTTPEREWVRVNSFGACVHIGVDQGCSCLASLAGARTKRVVGVDIEPRYWKDPPGIVQIIKGNSQNVWRGFFDPIDFLFIDGDHYWMGVHGDMVGWLGKVRPGGIVAFHDYTDIWQDERTELGMIEGVKEAVDGWNWASTTWERIEAPDSIAAFKRKPFLRAGDEWGTIGIGIPWMKMGYTAFRWFTWLLLGGLREGDQFLNDASVSCPTPLPAAHNRIMAKFLETDRDTLCIVEDDHVADQQIVERLRENLDNRPFDIVCASYVNRNGDPVPVGFWLMDKNDYGERWVLQKYDEVAKEGTQQVDGASFGLTLIRRWVLDAILAGRDPAECFWCDWVGRNSHDIQFYANAHKVGARVAVDRDNEIGHIGETVRTMAAFHEWIRPALEEKARKETDATIEPDMTPNGTELHDLNAAAEEPCPTIQD